MKYFMLLLSLWAAAGAAAQTTATPKLRISRLSGDFYVYTTYGHLDDGSRFPSNSLYVVTEKGIVMVDVPWDTTQTLVLVERIERRHRRKVIACISTHFHEDRTAGVNALKARGIKTYALARTRALCQEKHKEVPEFALPADTVFDFGNHKMRVYYPGPGHAPDNVVAWFPAEKILYGGCFVKSMEAKDLGNLSDADPAAWQNSIKKVQQQFPSFRYLVPGHGSWSSLQALDHTQQLVQAYLQQHQ